MALVKLSSYSRKSLEKATRVVAPKPVHTTEIVHKTDIIEKQALPSLSIDGNGELIAVFSDGSYSNLGRVVGSTGPMPKHEVKNGEVRFEKPDGSWGPWIRTSSPPQVVERHMAGGGGLISQETLTQLISFAKERNVRITNTDTTVNNEDDIIIVTAEATITLPDGPTRDKIIKIKRSGAGNVTVQGINGQTVEGEAFRVINVNLYALELRYDEVNTWVEL